jgi:glycosyltransferase involved in cell wall biosynthesis
MKNILLVGNWSSDTEYAWWLMETFWVAIARKFQDQCRVIVCYPQVTTVSQRLIAADIEVVEFDFGDPNPARLIRFLRSRRIGCVYLTDRSYVSWRYLLLRLIGVRRIILHDHTPGVRSLPTPSKRLVKRCITAVAAVTADAYVAVSDQVLRRLINVACLPERKCHLARNGIDVDKIVCAPPGNVRGELGISAQSILVVSSGRMTPYKNIHTIVEAADILINRKNIKSVFFVHCGDGPARDALAGRIDDLGLREHFFLAGMRNDIPGVLKSADIAVHPSQGEGLSLSILEFMCAGLPVIVSDDPSVSQTVQHNRTGLLFKTGSAEDLAAQLEYLIESKAARASLGANAAADVRRHYTLDGTVTALLSVFDGELGKAKRTQTGRAST